MEKKSERLRQSTFPEELKQMLPRAKSTLSDEQKGWIVQGPNCQVVFWEVHKKGGYKFKRHSHPFIEWAVVLEGAGTRIVGGKVMEVHEGDEVYIPPGVEHEVHVTSDTWRAVDFWSNPDWIKKEE